MSDVCISPLVDNTTCFLDSLSSDWEKLQNSLTFYHHRNKWYRRLVAVVIDLALSEVAVPFFVSSGFLDGLHCNHGYQQLAFGSWSWGREITGYNSDNICSGETPQQSKHRKELHHY